MRQLTMILGVILISHLVNGQDFPKTKYGTGFKSIFQKLDSGEYKGTVNGLLIIQDLNKVETILDFQGSDSKLSIKPDPDKIYDESTKIYKGKTTNKNTEIEYRTYYWANAFAIKLNDNWYGLSIIDGDCSFVIDGLEYAYKRDKSTEYLILQFTSEITLSNYNYLVKAEPNMNRDKVPILKKMEKKIKILPNSVVVFAIKRQK